MIREMLRISLLLAGATVGLTAGEAPLMAQTVPQPRGRIDVPLMTPNYGTPTTPARRLDNAQNSIRLQSCGGLSGAAADRCYSDTRSKIIADDLRHRDIEASKGKPEK